ncbi:activating transcription factor 3-like [Pocillopora verrucosa]|uniref:activating transcription factor 3-like n=1 Tax=Pocillopora verrucosa TaxID=203993 RepID=UPI0027974670|nr:activating transcription factor 3-like [Pocillopora verrucosa]
MEARVPVAPGFDENCPSMIHEFTGAPKDLSELVDCTPQTNANLFDMHIKPELRCSVDDGGEDVDMEYMMEMNFEYDHGNEALTADEQERRRIRRERNKVAASKCRKKRKEHVKTLVEASEELEHQNNDLQAQISKLQAEIKKLEFMLDSHSCAKYSHTPQDDHELGLNANLS